MADRPLSYEITPRQQEIFDRVMAAGDAPRFETYRLVGISMGIKADSVKRQFQHAKSHGAVVGSPTRLTRDAPERKTPERTAQAIDRLTDPETPELPKGMRLEQIAAETHLPVRTVKALKERLERNYLPLKQMLGNVKGELLRDRLGQITLQILESINQGDLVGASLRDKATAVDALMRNWLLLDGRPTAIIQTQADREQLKIVMANLVLEMRRRGVKIERPEMKQIEPVAPPDFSRSEAQS